MTYIRDETAVHMHGKLCMQKDSAMNWSSTVAN